MGNVGGFRWENEMLWFMLQKLILATVEEARVDCKARWEITAGVGVKVAWTRVDMERENEGGLICSISRTGFRMGFKQEKDKIQLVCFCVF